MALKMQNITIPNLTLEDIAGKTLEEALKTYILALDAKQQEDRERLVDFYMSQQLDKDTYLKQYFNTQVDENGEDQFPFNLILSQVNLTAKIIDRKAKAYKRQPVRSVDGKENTDYNELLADAGIKTTDKLIDAFTWLLGDVCLVIIADEAKKALRFDVPYYYRPIFKQGDAINPVGVMYPVGLVTKEDGNQVEGWMYWDAKSSFLLESGTWDIIKQTDNPENKNYHGTFNAVFTHKTKPFRGHWTKDANDLVDMNRDVNIAMTSINNAVRYHGFPILAALGVDPEKFKDIVVRFDQGIAVAADPTGKTTVDLKMLIPAVNWDGLWNSVKTRISITTATWGINVKFELAGTLGSGIALKILDIENSDDIEDIRELYEEFLEKPLFEKVKIISTKIGWMKKITGEKLSLDWPSEQSVETEDERSKRIETDVKNNLSNPIQELQRVNPDLDDDEAARIYLRNVKMNALLSSGKATESAILDILSGIADGEVQDLLEEPAPAPSPAPPVEGST